MDSTFVSPYVTASSDAGKDEPHHATDTDCIPGAKSSLDGSMYDKSTMATVNCVLSHPEDDGNGYTREDEKGLQYMNETDIMGTASASSSGSPTPSRRLSGSQSSVSSTGEKFANEQASCSNGTGPHSVQQGNVQAQEILEPEPEGIRTERVDSVFAQESTGLPSTVVRAPALYVESMPGKKIRDKAAHALNIWLQATEGSLGQIRKVISLLHNASLILDDVEDGSISRRGRPATHMVFGIPQAINSAGYQINTAMVEVLKLGDAQCIDIFAEEMDRLYLGQGYDLFWTFSTTRPSIEQYMSMVDYKTGALFSMLVRLMAAKSEVGPTETPDLTWLVVLLGRYFQIRDDYMNLTSAEYTDQKGFCEDLDEGKFSLTLVHALEHATETDSHLLRHILAQRHIAGGMSLAQKHLVLSILKGTGSLDFTVSALRRIDQEIGVEISRIEEVTGVENRPLRTLFEMLRV